MLQQSYILGVVPHWYIVGDDKERGVKPEQPQKIHIRVPPSLKSELEQAAEREERSINSWVVLAIKEKLKRDKAK